MKSYFFRYSLPNPTTLEMVKQPIKEIKHDSFIKAVNVFIQDLHFSLIEYVYDENLNRFFVKVDDNRNIILTPFKFKKK